MYRQQTLLGTLGIPTRRQSLSEQFNQVSTLYPTPGRIFNPHRWVGPITNSNCYTYALNLTTPNGLWLRPGQLDVPNDQRLPLSDQDMTPDNLKHLVMKDGLLPIEKSDIDHRAHHALAFFANDSEYTRNFHVYRLDATGYWSHKFGPGAPRDTDEAGRRITDIDKADKGLYTAPCGLFVIPPQGVRYRL